MQANITNYYWQEQAQPIELLKKKLKTQGRPKRLKISSADGSHPYMKIGVATDAGRTTSIENWLLIWRWVIQQTRHIWGVLQDTQQIRFLGQQ